VGAIANEADLDSRYIGHIRLFDTYSLVDLPQGMPPEVFRHLQSVWVCGRQLRISRVAGGASEAGSAKKASRRKASAKNGKKRSAGKRRAGAG
jgi:ATP-dependent RNA helicase DeaD